MKFLSIFLLATVVAAQTPAPKPVEEKVTTTESIALNQLYQEYQKVLQTLSEINIDVTKSHPGYHLDPQNPFSGKLVKDEPKAPAIKASPEKK